MCLLLAAGPLQAQLDHPLELSLDDLLEVRISSASKFSQSAREAPSAVEVITREDIRRHGWRTLGEAINSLAGVYVVSDRAYDFAGARGFLIPGDYNTRFLLLVDGQRSNDNIYEQASFGDEFIVDLALIERIEYVPGPGSAIYGSNAIFGTINVVTRRAVEMPPTAVATRLTTDGWKEARTTLVQKLDSGAALMFSATVADKDGRDLAYDDPVGGLLLAGGANSPDGVAHGLDVARKRQFVGRFEDGGATLAIHYGERQVQPSSGLYGSLFDDPGLMLEDRLLLSVARYARQTSATLRVEGRIEYGEVWYDADLPYDDGGGNRYLNRDEADGAWWAGELRANYDGLAGHRLVTGIEFQADRKNRQRNFDIDAAVNAPVDVARKRHRQAVFLLDEWRFAERWRLNVGARFDDFSDIQARTSPRGGVIWQVSEATTFKLLGGQAFRSPNSYERDYQNGVNYLASPNLRPESIRTTEGVWEQRVGARQSSRVTFFEYRFSDLIVQQNIGGGTLQYQNQPVIKAKGVEASWQYHDDAARRFSASLALNDTKDSAGRRPGFSPPWVAKVRGSVPVGGSWSIAVDGYGTGATTYDWFGTSQRLPTRALLDLVLTSATSDIGLSGHLRVRNLFDRRYAHPASSEAPVPALAGDGREFEFALRYAF